MEKVYLYIDLEEITLTHHITIDKIIYVYFQSHNLFNKSCNLFKEYTEMVYVLPHIRLGYLQTNLDKKFVQII